MIDSYITIDNCIPKSQQNDIDFLLTEPNKIPWYFTTESTYENEKIEKTSVMYHMMYYYLNGGITSELFHSTKSILWNIAEKAELPFHEFLQIRAVVQFPIKTERTHNLIHTDIQERVDDYYTAVYYVNDETDGDTVIFDQISKDIHHTQVKNQYKKFTEIARISPTKGKATVFHGTRYHASTLPTRKTRFILNFSWF